MVPVISQQSWAERLPRSLLMTEQQSWSLPAPEPFAKLEQAYAVYTFDHETAHAVYHHLKHADRPAAHGLPAGKITQQQDETFADIAGGLGIVGHFEPKIATDTITRLAHLRAIAAVQNGDIEHLTTRGLKRAMATIANPSDEANRWQLTGMDGARALAHDIPHYAFSTDELAELNTLARLMKPGDTFSADTALRVTGELARDTESPVIHELMRDYIDGVQALVPHDRYDPAALMRAKLNVRRSPLAAVVDARHPRVETVRAETLQRVDRQRPASCPESRPDQNTGSRPANDTGPPSMTRVSSGPRP